MTEYATVIRHELSPFYPAGSGWVQAWGRLHSTGREVGLGQYREPPVIGTTVQL